MAPQTTSPASPARPGEANRLSFSDDLFARIDRILDLTMTNQYVWWFAGEYPAEAAERLAARLNAGALSRLLHRTGFPLARDRWVAAPPLGRFAHDPEPIAPEQVRAWLREREHEPLDAGRGPIWRMASVRTTTGDTVVCFHCPHVLVDGSGMNEAFVAAVGDRPLRCLPDDSPAAARLNWVDDAREAGDRVRAAWAGLRTLPGHRRRAPIRSGAHEKKVVAPKPGGHYPPDWEMPTLAVEFDAAAFEAAARERGGTSNTLVMAFAVGLLELTGRIGPGQRIPISTPVNGRAGPEDLRGNTAVGVTIEVDWTREIWDDLTPLRAATRETLRGLSDGTRPDRLGPVKPLLQMVPDWLARKAAGDTPAALCTASNLGRMPDPVQRLGGGEPRAMLVGSLFQGMDAEAMRRSGGGVSVWGVIAGPEGAETLTLSVLGMDPTRFTSTAQFEAVVRECARRWGLTCRTW